MLGEKGCARAGTRLAQRSRRVPTRNPSANPTPPATTPPAPASSNSRRVTFWMRMPASTARDAPDRAANAHIGSAAAEVPPHRLYHVVFRRMSVLREQRGGGHDLSALAVAALRHLFGN